MGGSDLWEHHATGAHASRRLAHVSKYKSTDLSNGKSMPFCVAKFRMVFGAAVPGNNPAGLWCNRRPPLCHQ